MNAYKKAKAIIKRTMLSPEDVEKIDAAAQKRKKKAEKRKSNYLNQQKQGIYK